MARRELQLGVVASFLIAAALTLPNMRPPYVDCLNSNECGTFECCAIGMGRFSLPSCKLMGEVGDPCSPDSKPHAANLSYPDGWEVSLKNIYYTICPCSPGLMCSRESSACFDPTKDLFDNKNDPSHILVRDNFYD